MKKILLVEPDILLGKTYQSYLQTNGYSVRLCGDVQKAIDYIDKSTPDLIILELQLAAHNGYEFLYELRSYVEWQTIPVIIHSMIPDHVLGIGSTVMEELGVSAYLYKPTTSLNKLLYTAEHNLVTASR